MDASQTALTQMITATISSLPKALQEAIASSPIKASLQRISTEARLHIDQAAHLELEVMATLLGIRHIESFSQNLQQNINIKKAEADKIAQEVNETILKPIRRELERLLDHPEALERQVSDIDAARSEILGAASNISPAHETTTDAAVSDSYRINPNNLQ